MVSTNPINMVPIYIDIDIDAYGGKLVFVFVFGFFFSFPLYINVFYIIHNKISSHKNFKFEK